MKKKNIKIAIISPSFQESAKISINLSEILSLPYIYREATNDEYQILYNKKKKERYTSNEIYTIILSEFHSRIKTEKIPSFISNGTVLNEIVLKKWEMNYNKIYKRNFLYWILGARFREFESKVIKLIEDYAQTAYDKVYFLKNTNSIQDEFISYFEYTMLEMLNRKKINYTFITGDYESFSHSILNDLDTILSPDI